MGIEPDKLCSRLLELDRSIRFAGLADRSGKLVAAQYRKGLAPFLTREESELSAAQSVIRMSTRKALEKKLGKTVYAMALYEKVRRVSMALDDENLLLMISFDTEADHEKIILNSIIPLIKKR